MYIYFFNISRLFTQIACKIFVYKRKYCYICTKIRLWKKKLHQYRNTIYGLETP